MIPANVLKNESVSRAWETYQNTVVMNKWIKAPIHAKQSEFLLHTHTKEVFYGGAGGGGKSQALLYGALQYVDTPGYAALILRRRYTDLSMPEAIMDRAINYLHGSPASWNGTNKQFTFPSGATINFGYMDHENDKLRYRGGEYQYIGFDELTDFSDTQYSFLFSRLRRKKFGPAKSIPLRMRSASNPGGVGHEWVRRRFVDAETRRAGAVFIPAGLRDNPSLDAEGYLDSLSYTDPITRMQIEEGNWDGIEGGRFLRAWFKNRHYRWEDDRTVVHAKDRDGKTIWRINPMRLPASSRFFTIDFAASEKDDADYTVISVWCLSPTNDLIWLACYRFRAEIPEIIPAIQKQAKRWQPGIVAIEAVASNNAVLKFCQRSTSPVMNTMPLNPRGKDKLVRATPAMNLAHQERIWVPENGKEDFPYDEAMGELYRFTGDEDRDAHDDVVDTVSYAADVFPTIDMGVIGPPRETTGDPAAFMKENIPDGSILHGMPGRPIGRRN